MFQYNSQGFCSNKQRLSIILATVLLAIVAVSPTTLYAQDGNPDPLSCYGVGDEWLSTDGTELGTLDPGGSETDFDYLAVVDRLTGEAIPIGPTGTRGIEAIAFVPNIEGPIYNALYALANEGNLDNATANTLGTISLATGIWTPLTPGVTIGSGTGVDGTDFTFTDIDGLTYDVQRNILWATQRNGLPGMPDYLLQIDPVTGLVVEDGFGAGVAWAEVEVATDPRFVTPEGDPYDDIDDLAVDPVTGRMFIIMNNGGEGGGLVELDPADGSVISYIGLFTTDTDTSPDGIADDLEGLAFFNDGRLYGSSGNNGPQPIDSDRIYQINLATGEATLIDAFPSGVQDIESLGCLTAPAFIDLEKATNGEDADDTAGPTISIGGMVTWTYVIENTGAVPLINLTLTDSILGDITDSCAEGALPNPLNPRDSFTCTVTGIADTEGQYENIGTVSAVYLAPVQNDSVEFELSATDPSHYVGIVDLRPGIEIVKTAGDAADGETLTISPAGAVTFTYVVTNSGNTYLTEITITDDAGTPDDASDDVTVDSSSCAALAGPLEPQGTVACTAEIQVNGDATNVAETTGTPSDENGISLPNLDPPTANDDAVVTVLLAQIGNIVWLDQDADGIQDSGEPGLENIEVTLFDEAGTVVGTQVTDENGNYLFDVAPGTYSLGFNLEALGVGYYLSPRDSTEDEGLDSDADEQDGRTVVTSLLVGETDLNWDAGVFAPPILLVAKATNNTEVEPGKTIEYTINYSNTGISDANGVIITESIPQYTTFAPELSTDGWNCDGNETIAGTTCLFEIGTVAKNSTGRLTLTFTVIVDTELPESASVINNVIQISDDGSGGTSPTAAEVIQLSTPISRIPTAIDTIEEPGNGTLYLPMILR